MQLYFCEHISEGAFILSEEESKHCIRVLRHKTGDTIHLIDGKGNSAKGIIEQANPANCSGSVQDILVHPSQKKHHLHLAVSAVKQHERLEWMLEKVVELGIDEITFIECKRTERPRLKMERLHRICLSAIKQSQQFVLPKLNELTPFAELLKNLPKESARFIAWCPETKENQ